MANEGSNYFGGAVRSRRLLLKIPNTMVLGVWSGEISEDRENTMVGVHLATAVALFSMFFCLAEGAPLPQLSNYCTQ